MSIPTIQKDVAQLLGDKDLQIAKVTLHAGSNEGVKVTIDCFATTDGAAKIGKVISTSSLCVPK